MNFYGFENKIEKKGAINPYVFDCKNLMRLYGVVNNIL